MLPPPPPPPPFSVRLPAGALAHARGLAALAQPQARARRQLEGRWLGGRRRQGGLQHAQGKKGLRGVNDGKGSDSLGRRLLGLLGLLGVRRLGLVQRLGGAPLVRLALQRAGGEGNGLRSLVALGGQRGALHAARCSMWLRQVYRLKLLQPLRPGAKY